MGTEIWTHKETSGLQVHRGKPMSGHRENSVIWKPKEWVRRHQTCQHLDLGLSIPRTARINFWNLIHPMWYFVMASPQKKNILSNGKSTFFFIFLRSCASISTYQPGHSGCLATRDSPGPKNMRGCSDRKGYAKKTIPIQVKHGSFLRKQNLA